MKGSIIKFLGQIRAEISKIEWPNFDAFTGSTILILLIILFFAIFLGIVDRVISMGAKYLFTYGS